MSTVCTRASLTRIILFSEMLKISQEEKISEIFLKANEECDGIFGNLSIVKMEFSKLIN